MAKLLRVFLNSDMRCSHDGLKAMAAKEGVNPEDLEQGEYLLFLNSERNRIKLFACNNVLAYLKVATGKIDLRTISLIPRAFMGSGKIDYEGALKEVILTEIARKGK